MAVLILSFVLYLFCIILFKAVKTLPVYELRRQARAGRRGILAVHTAASYGISLDLILWAGAAGFLSVSVISSLAIYEWLPAAVIFMALAIVSFVKLPLAPAGPLWMAAALAAGPAGYLAKLLHPLTSPLGRGRENSSAQRGVIFEKQDLASLIKSQKNFPGNRIDNKDLQVVEAGLEFSNKKVNQAMISGRDKCFVLASEPIGPLLMDELYSRGRFAYLVVKALAKNQSPKPIGTLFLRDLVGHKLSGTVKNAMSDEVYYINEEQPVGEALEAMLKTQSPILAAVNNFEEVTGVISLEDIVGQLLPGFMASDFENYANIKAVANWNSRAEMMAGNITSSEKSGRSV